MKTDIVLVNTSARPPVGRNLAEFIERYDEAKLLKRQRRAERAQRDAAAGKEIPDFVRDRNASRRAAEKAVLAKHDGELRSHSHPILKAFVSKLHRASKLLTGDTKDHVDGCDSKLLALECRYTAFNSEMVGLIRTDLDGTWSDEVAFRADLYDCLDVRAWPAFAVCLQDGQGRVIRPHVYHVLGDSVCMTAKGLNGPKRLLKGVRRGLVEALLPMGADPGALAHALHGKNPCCWDWHVIILTGELCTLEELGRFVRKGVHDEDLFREAATVRAPKITTKAGDTVPSNQFFNTLQQHAFEVVGTFKGAEAEFQEFAAEMALFACGISATSDETQARAIALRVADYVWTHYDPTKKQRDRPNRGRCRHLVQDLGLSARQAIGGQDTAERRSEATRERLIAAYVALVQEGRKPTQQAVAAASSLSARTVKRRWAEIVESGVKRCIVKKGRTDGAAPAEGAVLMGKGPVILFIVPRHPHWHLAR